VTFINSILAWVGGKMRLSGPVIARIPPDIRKYVEVFGGAAWVLFRHGPQRGQEEVYNDANDNLVNLFRVVRDRPIALLKELLFLPLTSRADFNVLLHHVKKGDFLTNPYLEDELELAEQELTPLQYQEIAEVLLENADDHDVKRAAVFFKLIRYSYGAGGQTFGGQKFNIFKVFHLIQQASYRLRDTVIEHKDFEALIRQHDKPGAFFYLDPPYFQAEDCYEVSFAWADHVRLAETLRSTEGRWLLSYNDCSEIRELYDGFYIESITRLDNLAQVNKPGQTYDELLISNYDTQAVRRSAQLSLWDIIED